MVHDGDLFIPAWFLPAYLNIYLQFLLLLFLSFMMLYQQGEIFVVVAHKF